MSKAKTFCGITLLIILISLVGCSKTPNSINDFSRFSTMKQGITDRIEVEFDNYSGSTYKFIIDDNEDVQEIMNIIFSSSFKKMDNDLFGIDNTSIIIVQGENSYKLHVLVNREGKNYYSFETTKLQDKITEAARETGAFSLTE